MPDELRNQRYIEEKLRKSFTLWGYEEVRTPTIEYLETLSTDLGSELAQSMFKFQDFDGRMLALRPEMTTPVARMITTRMFSAPEPIRLFYISSVFRYSRSYVERGREFRQAGVELVGRGSDRADGEVISLLASSLRELGLVELRLDLGHTGLFKEIQKSARFDPEKEPIFRTLIGRRDRAELEKFMSRNDFPWDLKKLVLELCETRKLGEAASALESRSVFRKVKKFAKSLSSVEGILSDHHLEDEVFFDFSLTGRIEYYTGIVFEASVPGFGFAIGGGGRYDDLIWKLSEIRIPAVGFAIEIEKCLQALRSQGSELSIVPDDALRVLVSSTSNERAVEIASLLRESGVVAITDIADRTAKNLLEYGKLAKMNYVVIAESDRKKPLLIHNVRSGVKKRLQIKGFLQEIFRSPD